MSAWQIIMLIVVFCFFIHHLYRDIRAIAREQAIAVLQEWSDSQSTKGDWMRPDELVDGHLVQAKWEAK